MKLSTLIYIYVSLEDEKRSLKEQLHEVTESLSDMPSASTEYEEKLSLRNEIIDRLREVDHVISDLMGVNWRNG